MDDREFHSVIAHLRVAGTDNQSFEVKSCRKELTRDIGRTISGFANASGGTIICGLDENDDFKPVKGFDAARIQDALANYCGEKMRPPIRPIIETFILEGKPVLAAHIPELLPVQKPCYITASGCYGGSYIRVGDGDRRLSGYEIDRLIDEHEQPRYDDRIVREATLDDLDPDLVTGLLRRERSLHPSRLGTMDDETLLCKLHVAKADDHGLLHPTLAGLLALGTYPQEFYPCLVVTFTSYPGRIKAETLPGTRRFVDSFTCVGPIPDMIEDAVAAVTKNMRTGSRIQGTFRYDVPDYPAPAVREAIANALMHRDYSPNAQGTSVAVDLYADRLEIINPGDRERSGRKACSRIVQKPVPFQYPRKHSSSSQPSNSSRRLRCGATRHRLFRHQRRGATRRETRPRAVRLADALLPDFQKRMGAFRFARVHRTGERRDTAPHPERG